MLCLCEFSFLIVVFRGVEEHFPRRTKKVSKTESFWMHLCSEPLVVKVHIHDKMNPYSRMDSSHCTNALRASILLLFNSKHSYCRKQTVTQNRYKTIFFQCFFQYNHYQLWIIPPYKLYFYASDVAFFLRSYFFVISHEISLK